MPGSEVSCWIPVMTPFSKRRARINQQCEQIRERRNLIQYHRQAVQHGALAVCRRPTTLGAAFVAGGMLAYIFGPCGNKLSSKTVRSEQPPRPKGPLRRALEMALISYLSRLFEQIPNALQRSQSMVATTGESASSQPD